MSCGVGRRRGSDPALLWLWHRLAATALIRLLAWEPPYAMGGAPEKAKIQKKKKKEQNNKIQVFTLLVSKFMINVELSRLHGTDIMVCQYNCFP